jgi:hypothetical protein
MRSVTNPTLVGQFRSMCQSIRSLPNFDKPNLVVCKLALMKAGTITLIFHTLTKLDTSCHGSFINLDLERLYFTKSWPAILSFVS